MQNSDESIKLKHSSHLPASRESGASLLCHGVDGSDTSSADARSSYDRDPGQVHNKADLESSKLHA